MHPSNDAPSTRVFVARALRPSMHTRGHYDDWGGGRGRPLLIFPTCHSSRRANAAAAPPPALPRFCFITQQSHQHLVTSLPNQVVAGCCVSFHLLLPLSIFALCTCFVAWPHYIGSTPFIAVCADDPHDDVRVDVSCVDPGTILSIVLTTIYS